MIVADDKFHNRIDGIPSVRRAGKSMLDRIVREPRREYQ